MSEASAHALDHHEPVTVHWDSKQKSSDVGFPWFRLHVFWYSHINALNLPEDFRHSWG